MNIFLICVFVVLCLVLWWRWLLAWFTILVLLTPLIARVRAARNRFSSSSHSWMATDLQLCILLAHRRCFVEFGKRSIPFDDLIDLVEAINTIPVPKQLTTFTDHDYRTALDELDRIESRLIYVHRRR